MSKYYEMLANSSHELNAVCTTYKISLSFGASGYRLIVVSKSHRLISYLQH